MQEALLNTKSELFQAYLAAVKDTRFSQLSYLTTSTDIYVLYATLKITAFIKTRN